MKHTLIKISKKRNILKYKGHISFVDLNCLKLKISCLLEDKFKIWNKKETVMTNNHELEYKKR